MESVVNEPETQTHLYIQGFQNVCLQFKNIITKENE